MKNRRKQKLICALLVWIFIFAGFFPSHSLAQATSPAASQIGNGLSDTIKGLATPVLPVIAVILSVTQALLTVVLSFASWLLNVVFQANLTMNPGNMEVVRTGWTITRDVANSVFILIVLWIAFTIIFGIEQFGGKKLLVRTIVIAFLINFSLVLVTVVFGFSNMLANVFARQINDTDVAGIMVNATKLHTIVRQITESNAQAIAGTYKRNEENAGQIERGELLQQEVYLQNENSFAENIVPQRPQADVIPLPGTEAANAQVTGALAGCGIGALFGGPFGCAGGAIAGAIAEVFGKVSTGLFDWGFRNSISLAMSNILLIVAIGAFSIGAVTLLVRLIMEILLSIVAPLAFIVQIIPSKNVSKYWSQWIEAVFRWAFFAPMFYFLFYLTLYMLQRYDTIVARTQGQTATVANIDFDRILQLLVALGMLFASYKLARKTGGVVAETAISWAQGAGSMALGGVAGFAARTALPRLGAAATTADKGIAGIENKYVRQMLAIPQRGLQVLSGAGRAQEKKAEKGISDMTSDEIKRAFATGQFRTQAERTAGIRKLASSQELGADEKIKGYTKAEQPNLIRAAIDQIKSTGGEYLSLLRTNPELARASDFDISSKEFKAGKEKASNVLGREANNNETAQWLIVSKMRPDHITKNFDSGSLSNPVMRDFTLASWRGEHWNALNRQKPSAVKDVAEHIQKKEVADRIVPQMDAGQYQFFMTALARAMGMRLPAGHKESPAVLKEKEQNLEEEIAQLTRDIRAMTALGLADKAKRKEQRRAEKEGELKVVVQKLTGVGGDEQQLDLFIAPPAEGAENEDDDEENEEEEDKS